jgi:hypothetical protein
MRDARELTDADIRLERFAIDHGVGKHTTFGC